jgi:3-deoxy-D-manno-octulosonic acid (KDO) 8-phosphate synthase
LICWDLSGLFELPVLSDVHQVSEIESAQVLDVIQIPAFYAVRPILIGRGQTGCWSILRPVSFSLGQVRGGKK